MKTNRTRPTRLSKRHLVLLLAIACGAAWSIFSDRPGWWAGAQAPVNNTIAFDRDGDLFVINTDGSGEDPLGPGFGPSYSPNGEELAYSFPDTIETNLIYKMKTDGTETPVALTDSYQEHGAAWSPDGSQIVFVSERIDNDWPPGDDLHVTPRLYLMAADGSGEQKVMTRTQSQTAQHVIEQEYSPTWSPDGSQIAFIGHARNSNNSSRTNIYVVNKDGSGLREVTHFENGTQISNDKISWSKDGTKIAFQMSRDIHLINPDGLSAAVNITNTTDREESDPAFSPGGARIAYVVNHFTDNAKDGLYIMKSNGQDQTQILSSTGQGRHVFRPAWHPHAQDPTEDPQPGPSPEADLSINLSATPAQPQLGNNVTYTLVVKNNGPGETADSFAAFTRTPNLDLVSATPACQPSSTDPLGTVCSTGALLSGASKTVTIVVRPTTLGEVGLSGNVGATPVDPNLSNNSQTVNVTVVPVPVPTCVPEVTSEVQAVVLRPGGQSQRRVRHLIIARNTSGRTLNGLVHFVFDGLDNSISDGDPRSTFFRTRCAQPLGRQFKTIGLRDLVWRPGQIILLEVEFFNPERVRVNYNLRLYTGPGYP